VRTYAQYCPIVRAVEVLGERWTLLIVREMLNGAGRFNELSRGLPGLSRGLLSRRLRQLVAAGLVRRTEDAYELTPAGEDLRPLVFGLAEWGARHAFGDPRPEELDPEVLCGGSTGGSTPAPSTAGR
jgi:DNA-binding HxlR family transcriptional regulator